MRAIAIVSLIITGSVMTFAQSASKQTFGANPNLPFSGAVKAGGLIYVAGSIGPASGELGKDIKTQTKQTLDNISATLTSAGSSMANVASMMVYLRNAADFAAMNEVYATYWPKDPPTRTTVVVTQPLALPDGLIEISAVAIPNGGERVVVHPPDWIKSPNPYSYGIKSGNTLFLAGLISRNGKDNTPIKGDMKVQTKTVLENASTVLKAGGMTFADVVSARVYVTDSGAFQDMNEVYRTYFPTDPPARATVKATLNSNDYLVEITMVAVRGTKTAITTPTEDGKPGTKNPNLSSAIRVGNRLYLSGILGNTPANKGDVKGQAAETMARIGRTLKAAGFDWNHLVEGMVYLPDLTKFADMNASYREPIAKDFPARATVGAGLMNADGAVEIMFTAVK